MMTSMNSHDVVRVVHVKADLIGSMSSPHSRELRKPIGSYERGRQPIDPKRAILPRWRTLEPIVEVQSTFV